MVDRAFLPGTHALLVPRTTDGRVPFAVPWLGKTILGTTDTPRHDLARVPAPFAEEVAFILGASARCLVRAPQRTDVRSVWVGLRPLVKSQGEDGDNKKALSREHTVVVGRSGLVTVTGGKWTTYRVIAGDVLGQAMTLCCRHVRAASRHDCRWSARRRVGPCPSHRANICTAATPRTSAACLAPRTGCGAMPIRSRAG